jgi:hypothetical protein
MTDRYGIIVFEEVTGEVAEPSVAVAFYPHVDDDDIDYIWGSWRRATLPELIATWPARHDPSDVERARGWWQPTLADLRKSRRAARSLERATRSRGG